MLPFEVKRVLNKTTSTSLNFVCKQICVWKVAYPQFGEFLGTVEMIKNRHLFSNFFEYKGEMYPVVLWHTGCWVWRRKVINRCEANVWDPIFVTHCHSQSYQVYDVKSLDRPCLVFWWPEAQSAPVVSWKMVGIKKNDLLVVKLEAYMNKQISRVCCPSHAAANIFRYWKPEYKISHA